MDLSGTEYEKSNQEGQGRSGKIFSKRKERNLLRITTATKSAEKKRRQNKASFMRKQKERRKRKEGSFDP